MNTAVNINKAIGGSSTVVKAKRKGIIYHILYAIQSRIEARKNLKAIREANEIKAKLRAGKAPATTFEQAIREL